MQRIVTYPNVIEPNHQRFGEILSIIAGPNTASKTMIDLCCHNANTTRHIPFKERTFVDIKKDIIPDIPPNFYELDVLSEHPIFEKYYDVSFAIDAIEHFLKSDGKKLLRRMELISKMSILFTPLGDYCVDTSSTDPLAHKSGWLPEEQLELGWNSLVFPKFHPQLGIGAFIFWKDTEEPDDFDRVLQGLSTLNMGDYVL